MGIPARWAIMCELLRRWGSSVCLGRGAGLLNRNQKAAARQLSLAAYLLSCNGYPRGEPDIREHLPPYADVYDSSLGDDGDRDRAGDALRKQLFRDVEALAGAGIRVEVEGASDGRVYRLPPSGFSPAELDLTEEERAVLVGALRTLRRNFPYAGPLRMAIANLIGAASVEPKGGEGHPDAKGAAFAAAVAMGRDEAVAGRIGRLEGAVSRRRRVRFDYYSISRDETSERVVEPYALSLLDGTWYVTGWDTGREAVRQFRVSRIVGRVLFAAKGEGADFGVPENFERRFAGPRVPWQLGEPDKTACVRLSEEGVRRLRVPLREAGTLERDDGGAVFVTRYSGERQLAGWVLSLGEDARAVSPASLVDRTTEGLERIAAAHGAERS